MMRKEKRNKKQAIEISLGAFFAFSFFIILCAPHAARPQNYPKLIRGYKVYNQKISVKARADKASAAKDSEAFVEVGEPKITDVSLSGATVEILPQIEISGQSGTVDFLAFKDFRVGGVKVEVEEYRESFSFRKGEIVALPEPIKARLTTANAALGALRKNEKDKNEWTVTGTIFVFGRFKKFGFDFKRVIPVEVNLKIKNPLSQAVSRQPSAVS